MQYAENTSRQNLQQRNTAKSILITRGNKKTKGGKTMETEIIKQNKVFLKELKEKLGIAGKIRHIQISPTYNKEGFLDDDKTSITFKEVNN